MAHDILIVDDEADIRMLIAGVLKDEGFATREAADSTQALAAIQVRQPTLVVLDIWLQNSEFDGIEILQKLRADMPTVPVVMISGHGTIETAVEAIKIGAYDFIEKPFKADRLLLLVARAIEAAQLRRENAELKALLLTAQERLLDMLKMDDGQAFSEADKFSKRLTEYLNRDKRIDVV